MTAALYVYSNNFFASGLREAAKKIELICLYSPLVAKKNFFCGFLYNGGRVKTEVWRYFLCFASLDVYRKDRIFEPKGHFLRAQSVYKYIKDIQYKRYIYAYRDSLPIEVFPCRKSYTTFVYTLRTKIPGGLGSKDGTPSFKLSSWPYR